MAISIHPITLWATQTESRMNKTIFVSPGQLELRCVGVAACAVLSLFSGLHGPTVVCASRAVG